MFARVKKSGKYQYLQIVENRKEAGKVRQQVITTLGRLDHLQEKGRVETLIRSPFPVFRKHDADSLR